MSTDPGNSGRARRFAAGVVLAALAMCSLLVLPAAASAALPPSFALPDLWSWSNPYPSGNELTSVSMPTATDAWAVNPWGEIYASDDGGTRWWLQRSTGDELWRRVYFRNINRGWVVGGYGAMRRTTNGGATWSTVDPGTSAHLNDVYFVSAALGWAGGSSSTLLKSTDGGATWAPKTNPAPSAVSAIRFYDADRGWIGDNSGGISRTTDGGAHWTRVLVNAGHVFNDIDVVSAKRGWAVGSDGIIVATTDGGATWSPQVGAGIDDLTTVDFSDALHGWATRRAGRWIATTDGGAHWTSAAMDGSFNAIAVPDGRHGCAVGDDCAVTVNGISWAATAHSATAKDLVDVSFARATTGWVVGADGKILHTSNGGTWWWSQTSPIAATASEVCAVSLSRAFIVGTDWSTTPESGFLLGTTDGGATWTKLQDRDDWWMHTVDFADALHGWAAPENSATQGYMLRTTDGGAHWSDLDLLTSIALRDIDFVSTTTGCATTNSGGVAVTTDGGAHWTNRTIPVGGMLNVTFADTTHGWAAGHDGHIVRTSDGGETWVAQTSGVSGSLWDIVAVSANRAVAVADGGVILRTVDGGAHWSQQLSHTDNDLRGAGAFADAAWVVGDGGTILSRGVSPNPHIVRVAPRRVKAGNYLTIYGWGFNHSGTKFVKIGKKTVTTTAFWRDLRVRVKVPKMAPGKKTVRLWAGTYSNAVTVSVR